MNSEPANRLLWRFRRWPRGGDVLFGDPYWCVFRQSDHSSILFLCPHLARPHSLLHPGPMARIGRVKASVNNIFAMAYDANSGTLYVSSRGGVEIMSTSSTGALPTPVTTFSFPGGGVRAPDALIEACGFLFVQTSSKLMLHSQYDGSIMFPDCPLASTWIDLMHCPAVNIPLHQYQASPYTFIPTPSPWTRLPLHS